MSNPYGVKPGQVWDNAADGYQVVVLSVKERIAYVQGLKSGIVSSRKLDWFCRGRNYVLIREDAPLPAMKVPQAKTAPYMTIIPGRNPQTKAHMTLGEAKKAVMFRLRGEVLSVECRVNQWEPTGWETLWKIDVGTKRDDLPWN